MARELVILYDGTCGFCHASVRWLDRLDPAGRLRYAPLQGTWARAHLDRGLREQLSTVVALEMDDGKRRGLWTRAPAILRAIGHARPWMAPLTRALSLPVLRNLLNVGYRVVAGHRHRIAGSNDACALPSPSLRNRFYE